ncbi:MAG: hypothetical protein F6K31_44250, partial [Symploca sp. SIO2G7]|nr:hypothetical protein [Symploca sp. SIO2G7]
TFSLAEGAGYTINGDAQTATVSFYDTLADVPAPSSIPTVGIRIDNTELVEATGDAVTLTFDVDGDIPDGGVLVFLDSGVRAAVGEFNIFNAEISGGVFPSANFLSSGFYFKLFEDGASITLSAFDETLNPRIDPEDAVEGIESFTFSIVEGPGYTIDPSASSVSYTIADTVDSVPLESLESFRNVPLLPKLKETDQEQRAEAELHTEIVPSSTLSSMTQATIYPWGILGIPVWWMAAAVCLSLLSAMMSTRVPKITAHSINQNKS